MTPLYVDREAIQRQLSTAALNLQTCFIQEEGSFYLLEDLEKALVGWLELSIEALVEDALFHTLKGDRAHAFNRHAFEFQMKQLQPISLDNSLVGDQTLLVNQPQKEVEDKSNGQVAAA